MNNQHLKQSVRQYWNQQSCGTEHTIQEKYSKEYFEEIEQHRYATEPEIHSFAQFSRAHGKKVLEVGIGAGTDFMQWVRSGAHAYGIDLTQEALNNVEKRLSLYHLHAQELIVADAENIPYVSNFFDITYSWGVIHHSPDTEKCLAELIRVTKPGGTIKIMIYHRHGLFAYWRWLNTALLKGKPWRSIADVLYYDQESLGTKAYTFKEVEALVARHPVHLEAISAPATYHDRLPYKAWPFRWLAYCTASIMGWERSGFFLMITLKKV